MSESESLLPSDEDLLARCRRGDERAFRSVVERYHGRLLATATGMLGPGMDAEAVVQDGLLRFYRNLEKFEGRSALGTYLTRIVMNQALKLLRQRQRWYRRFLSSDDPEHGVAEGSEEARIGQLEDEERARQIRAAVQQLKPEFRSVVVLRFLNEYSTEECARVLGIPQGTVMSRLSRALDKLAPLLKDLNQLSRSQ
ncbi:RNA polymerase sigma factor [Pelagicoccus sp. NFK12]|uniref:RNA polymerase sigma factor n=1 Tax=Pelagicoccus enzymogenes TaxID=2773457 RepID=A0A927FAM3_9BACT|nr:RNA polymerase sigma factor [Pelagicoccus enzymogenes]MBD5780919.1 RNA polymerase sigma factor [Pelagicoccus enzymogenes]MDQ8199957.1 RNA polymerase sigma factor [Pelagicoccus enzymogenes]